MFHVQKVEAYPSREALTGGIDFSIQLRNTNNQRYVLLDVRAPIFLRTPDGRMAYVDQAFLYGLNSYQEVPRNGETSARLFMPMTHANAVLVDEGRRNGKVYFQMHVVLLVLPVDGLPAQNSPPRAEIVTQTVIEKSTWVEEFLPAFGMDNHELWEIRFPRVPTPDALRPEAELLKKALHEHNNGEYANCYQNCRKVVESLKKRRAELKLDAVIDPEEWKRMTHYLSMALHVDDELPKQIGRREAEFAFTVTAALFRRVAHALQSAEGGAPLPASPKIIPEP